MIYQLIFEHKLQKLAKYQFPKKVREKSCHFASWGLHTQKSKLKLKISKFNFAWVAADENCILKGCQSCSACLQIFTKYKDCFTLEFYLQNRGSSNYKTSLFKKRNIKWKDCLTLRDFVLKQRQIGDEIMIGKLVGFKSIEKRMVD